MGEHLDKKQDKKNGKTTIIGIIPKHLSKNNIFARIKMPPIGLPAVLSQIAHYPILDVYAIDENNYGGPLDAEGFPDHSFLQKKEPAAIAMFYGGMSNSIPRMFSLAQQYKRLGAITIAGGSHVDALPQEALSKGIDIVVHGEGEKTIEELLEAIPLNSRTAGWKTNLEQIVGISFITDAGKYIFTGKRAPVDNLDSLEDPDLTLIKYLKTKWSAIPVHRGRGCNFKCEFCVVNTQYGKFKAASVEKTFRQIVKYSDMGYREFFITDDNFAQNPAEAAELCKMIGDYKRQFGRKKRKISLLVQVRTEVAENDKLIDAMRYAGVKTLCIGYESPINEELKVMHKGVTVEQMVQRSRKLSKHFYLHGMFIFGYPVDEKIYKSNLTLDQRAKAYSRFFKNGNIDTVQVMNAIPLPGSDLRARMDRENRLLPLDMVGWEKHDGLFVCYDPGPDVDAYMLQKLPKLLMEKKYVGNRAINRSLNYGNWINWAYHATIGFPIQFGSYYVREFTGNLARKKKEKLVEDSLLPDENIFYESMSCSWKNIKRNWRNLAIRTYAAQMISRWRREHDRESRLSQIVRR